MTKQKFDKLYVGEKIAVNCRTEDLANEFLKLADSFGYKWWHGISFETFNFYKHFKEETCYYMEFGSFASLELFKNDGFEIVEYKGE